MDVKLFVYRDAKGNTTGRQVSDVSETKDHIQGICLEAGELRTFRKDRVLEFVDDPQALAARLDYHIVNSPPPPEPAIRAMPAPGQFEVCFTGFKKGDKDRLVQMSKDAGFFVRSSVTKDLDFLCYGFNAGPKKLEKARCQGVLVLSEKQFADLIENGEIPENA
jgi:NAD-dependent DNA ligase